MSRHRRLLIGSVIAAFWVVCCGSGLVSEAAETHWVALDGTGDFADIQSAIDAASAGDRIQVVAGTYTIEADDRDVIVWMDKDLVLVGGYAQVGAAEPDHDSFPTIVDGQNVLGRRVISTQGLTEDSLLSGFVITGGQGRHRCPDIGACAVVGGGMYNFESHLTIDRCVFRTNEAIPIETYAFGGGLNNDASDVTITNTRFEENESSVAGALSNFDSSPTIHGCEFRANRANTFSGGAMYNVRSSPVISESRFVENFAAQIGSAVDSAQSSPTFIRCLFQENTTWGRATVEHSQVTNGLISNCVFLNNIANTNVGVLNDLGTVTIVNTTFVGNTEIGGSISSMVVTQASTDEGTTIKNVIIWGNDVDHAIYGGPNIVSYSNIEGGLGFGTIDEGGNIEEDPLFVDGSGGDVHLTPMSPSVDRGTDEDAPDDDFEGTPRPQGFGFDMGAYEYVPDVPSCFLAGTPIMLPDSTTKPIEAIQVGDYVLAYDEATGQLKPDTVKETFVHPGESGYLVVNGHLKVTPNHPVYSNGEWVEIGTLDVGDALVNAAGDPEPITSIERVHETVTVYNFEVNPYHTYIAGGIIAHNKARPLHYSLEEPTKK